MYFNLFHKKGKNNKAFTLIELLIVIAIIAILMVTVVITINPGQLLAQSRDSNRLSDMNTIKTAIDLSRVDNIPLGAPNTTYISIPDPTATTTAGDQCQGLGLPPLPSQYVYHCAASSTYQKADGTGWIPISFTQISSGPPFSQIPIDSINQTSSNLFYTYTTDGTGTFELTSILESQKYKTQFEKNPQNAMFPGILESGNNLSLSELYNSNGLVGYWPLNEGTGTVAYDRSGNNTNLNIMSSSSLLTWQSGLISSGLEYSSNISNSCINQQTGIYTTTLSSSLINLPSGTFSLNVWVYFNNNPLAIFHLGGYSANGFSGLWITGNGVGFNNNGLVNTGFHYYNNISLSKWHLFTYIFNPTNMTHYVYIDGILAGSGSLSGTYGTFSELDIGDFNPGCEDASPQSIFDDASIYNRVLSPAEIQAIYNAEK